MPDESIKSHILSTPAADHWKRIGIHHHHGICVPLFSLHGKESCGIGEFPDLLPMISWCREIGFDIIQLLPLNDTGIDNSPYSAISANALNPIHLGISRLPKTLPAISSVPDLNNQIATLQNLNRSSRVDYPSVRKAKSKFLWDYFRYFSSTVLSLDQYHEFKSRNPWLLGYALFKTLKIQHQWQSWSKWLQPWRDVTVIDENLIPDEMKEEVEFHIFVQFLCFQQMEEVKQQATINGVFLKGDIPILLSRESADVWLNKKLFLLEYSAGAPPDMYAKEGQNWGFPPYNWQEHENEFYQWWIERLKVASYLYHIYRIDHIVGFYRIWAIPEGEKPNHGLFIPEEITSWIPNGQKIMLMMLENSTMLPIGEDLGTVPPEVRINLKSLGICGTKVMRWERRWNSDQRFIDPADYLAESMSTVSTHDSETLALWWKNQPDEAKVYAESRGWKYTLELMIEQRKNILKSCHESGSLFHINLLQEYLALIPHMTEPNPENERINIPGTISQKNWAYRFTPSVEEIISNQNLKESITELVPPISRDSWQYSDRGV